MGERSLPIPEIRSSNPVIRKFDLLYNQKTKPKHSIITKDRVNLAIDQYDNLLLIDKETGEIKFENGEKYFGYIQNGKPHGDGVLTDK